MSKQQQKPDLMGYLYGEISAEERQRVEEWLHKHPEEQLELEQLQETRSWLAEVPTVQSPPPPVFQLPKETPVRRLSWIAWAGAAAAVLLLLLTAVGMHVTVSEQGMTIAFGQTTSPAPTEVEDERWQQLLQALDQKDESLEKRLDSVQLALQQDLLQQQQQLLQNWQAKLTQYDAAQQQKLEQFAMQYYQKEVPAMVANMQNMQLQEREELQVILNDMWQDWLAVRSSDLQIIQANMNNLQENIEVNQNQTRALEDILVQVYK